ncbi:MULTISPECIES: apolipoprotein N-acyltransferase [Pseudanabaena]|uniref:Apolipoprotein N-acyltransferase n=2 Tax=Pseudanabaena TaxID=1152 RepID=L8N642_9CYAN|nr:MULTISPECIES: apolipoprotein N-acyltransferase [Pseudanabaena]ELS33693.1 Apolipoprotein N-acyltransferase [Pseudanabaena biceps PCC 7429]MDG3494086.1 apolipoprotein N-acyltransferase [Pseudanabaena catenata USMAC16]
MQNLQNLLFAALGGLLMGLTPDPFGQWWLAWIALMPLWMLAQRLKVKAAIAMGVMWGFCYHSMALFWITSVHPMEWMGVPWWNSFLIATLVWLLIAGWGAVLSGLWAGGMALFTQKLKVPSRLVIACAIFSGLEIVWSWGPLYWTALGYTQSPHDLLLLQVSRLSGQQTMTSAIVAVNGLLAETLLQKTWRDRFASANHQVIITPLLGFVKQWRYAIAVILLVLAMAGYGAWEMQSDRMASTNGKAIKAGIIQGNFPNILTVLPRGWEIAVDNYTKGYEKLAQSGAEMIVTPETAISFLYPNYDARREPFDRAVEKYRVPVWLGGFGKTRNPNTEDPNNYTNSLFLIDGSNQILSQYDKVRLVPVGEYIPFKAILGGLIKRLSPLRGEVEAGSSEQLVDTPWGRFILGICYESAYPATFRFQTAAGGKLILSASNNAHFASYMSAQHHAQDVARAIESDRWAVRATNTGYSGFVDPNGRTIWLSQVNTYETHAETVYLRDTKTLYVLWGDWMTPLLGVTSIAIYAKHRFMN